MDMVFTNDGIYFVSYGNDMTFGWVKFYEPYALPFFRLVLVSLEFVTIKSNQIKLYFQLIYIQTCYT